MQAAIVRKPSRLKFPATSRSTRFRPAVTIILVLIWLVLVSLLVKDRYFGGEPATTENLNIAAVESDDWFLIRVGGAYSGFGRSRQFRTDEHWTIRDELTISLNLQGQVKPVRVVNDSTVDENFRLINFHLKISSGIMSFEQKGRMEGRDLVLQIPGSQGEGTKRIKLSEIPRISRSLGLPAPLTGLKVGDEFHMPIFDPLDGNKWDTVITVLEKADLEIAAKKLEAWRVRAVFRTLDLVMWIDGQGRLLKGRMPMGITVVRSDEDEIAKEMKSFRGLPDLSALTAVPLEGSIPDSRDLRLLRLKVQSDRALSIPSEGSRQIFKDSELVLTKETIPPSTYKLPCDNEIMQQHLISSRFIRSDDPLVKQQAQQIVNNERDPIRAAGLINDWVHANLKKVPTAAVPDALSILRHKQGACNEHAVLAASLARAIGLPARIAVGLVYSADGFYYHAWVNYWAGDRWFTGDPLMGTLPVDPTHIALLYGDVDKHLNLISFLGQLKLKVLEVN